jgi:hypothetical protein
MPSVYEGFVSQRSGLADSQLLLCDETKLINVLSQNSLQNTLLGAFAKLRKATISSWPSVRM